jgi:hypothetical protein
MAEANPRRFNSLKDLILVGAPVVGALIIARIVFSNETNQGFSQSTGLGSFDFVTPGLVALLVITGLFYSLRRRGQQVARLVIAAIAITGTLSGLLLLKIWFDTAIMIPALFYVCAAPLGYLGLYLSVRSYFGVLSERKTLMLLSGSATFLGTLIGVLFPPLFTIVLLFVLSFLDILLVESDVLRGIVGFRRYESIVSATTVPMESQIVGIGDLLAYSMLTVASLRNGNLYVAGATIILILLGAFITSQAARSRVRFPGLPIPIFLGAAPYLLGLLMS